MHSSLPLKYSCGRGRGGKQECSKRPAEERAWAKGMPAQRQWRALVHWRRRMHAVLVAGLHRRTWSSCCTLGMRVEPPTSTTSCTSFLSILESLSTRACSGTQPGAVHSRRAAKAAGRVGTAPARRTAEPPAVLPAVLPVYCPPLGLPLRSSTPIPSPFAHHPRHAQRSAAQRSTHHWLHALLEEVHAELLKASAADAGKEVVACRAVARQAANGAVAVSRKG